MERCEMLNVITDVVVPLPLPLSAILILVIGELQRLMSCFFNAE